MQQARRLRGTDAAGLQARRVEMDPIDRLTGQRQRRIAGRMPARFCQQLRIRFLRAPRFAF
jgi:hypothetical protein